MFQVFKEKVGKLQNKHDSENPVNIRGISTWDCRKIEEQRNRPRCFYVAAPIPATLDEYGDILSLMSGAE